MLLIPRFQGESIIIGGFAKIKIVRVSKNLKRGQLGIEAPREISIDRGENFDNSKQGDRKNGKEKTSRKERG